MLAHLEDMVGKGLVATQGLPAIDGTFSRCVDVWRFVQHLAPGFYLERFGLDPTAAAIPNAPARFNVAPTQDVMVIRQNPETGKAQLSLLRWGLVPSWARI